MIRPSELHAMGVNRAPALKRRHRLLLKDQNEQVVPVAFKRSPCKVAQDGSTPGGPAKMQLLPVESQICNWPNPSMVLLPVSR